MRAADWQPDGTYTIRADARRFENWETYYAGKVGLGVAVDYALEIGLDAIRERDRRARRASPRRLCARSTASTLLDRGAVLAATVTFTVDGVTPAEVQAAARGARGERLDDGRLVGAARLRPARDRRG